MVLSGKATSQTDALAPVELTCEYARNPLGVDTLEPRFTWELTSRRRGQLQSAYQLLVSDSEERLRADRGDKWDSGKVASHNSVNVPYGGSPLTSGERCWWKVRCWDKHGHPSDYSAPASFEMGLLEQSDWEGDWIGMDAAGALRFVTGKCGQAVALDGSSETVRIPHYTKLKPKAQITISAWVKPGEALQPHSGNDWVELYRKDDDEARQLLALGTDQGVYGLWFGLGINGSYTEDGARLPVARLKDGQWHLLAATYDGSFKRLYADGDEIGRAAVHGPIDAQGRHPAYIGSCRGSTEFFPGAIDDVRVYERALPKAELARIADVESGLVGWWKLDGDLGNSVEGSGGEVAGAVVPAPLLRKEFESADEVKQARAYISGLGWYELYINGDKVGDHVLDPATTDYDKRILYVTYDVTEHLVAGANVVGIMLGNGWYSEPPSPGYGDAPRLLMQMNVRYAGGGGLTINTDRTWSASSGPITRNDLFGGETYDARLEKRGWAQAGYDDDDWGRAVGKAHPGGRLESQLMPAIKVNQTIKPLTLTQPKPGVYVYDMGQLFGGWARLRVKGERGTKVTIKYAARLFQDSGLVDKRRHPPPKETDVYILKGDPRGEVYEPRFTYHPVRYVQVEGHPATPALGNIEGRVVYSAVDMSGDFECSNALLNRIHRNSLWTITNGLYGFPLDCLHREHWGWLDPGTDASTLYARKHMPLFWAKWLRDAKHAQHADGVIPDVVPAYPLKGRDTGDPAWAGNYPILVWYLHQYYADERILAEHYASMRKWLDHLTSIADDHLVKKGHYGDHMLPGKSPGSEVFISKETSPPLLWTGYYYRNARIVSQTAAILGKTDDAGHYSALAEKIKDALNKRWLNGDACQYATGSQTANLFPMVLGIVPKACEDGVLKNIATDIMETHDGHLHTGNIGTTSMIEALVAHGLADVMYEIATTTTYPGWGYMVNQGATTIWEAWGERDDVGSGAESMVMWCSIDEFFYNGLAGIQGPSYYGPDYMTPGFRETCIKPHVLGDLKFARASLKTVRGMVRSSWERKGAAAPRSLRLEVSLPANSRGTVCVPKMGFQNVAVTEGGQSVWRAGAFVDGVDGIYAGTEDNEYVTFGVGSGCYVFELAGQPK